MAFGVPVKVIVASLPEHTEVALAEIVTVGGGTTVMVTDPVAGCVQLGVPEDATLTNVYVVVVAKVLLMVADPAASKTMVWLPVPSLYVTVAFGVPVNVIVALPPEQTEALDAIATVGGGKTVMITDPLAGALHPGVPDVATLTSVKVVVDVKFCAIVPVPAASKTMVWLPLPLLYVTVALGVPVKVTVALWPEQTVASADMLAVGGGVTVIVTEPVAGALQLGVPEVATLTKV